MVRCSSKLVLLLLVLTWTLIRTGYDIFIDTESSHEKSDVGKQIQGDIQERREGPAIDIPNGQFHKRHQLELTTSHPIPSKTKIKRSSSQETENITLAKDMRLKQEMTKYIARSEAEAEMRELHTELNRFFPRSDPQFSDTPDPSELEKLLTHMQKDHPPPSNHNYGHDVTNSNQKPVNRILPDKRPKYCKQMKYNLTALPTVSVVTPFHNEALTMLLRHIHALINNSPPPLLREIILVDDVSTLENLGSHFQEYVTKLDKRIKLIRNQERQGVSRSRMIGADAAKSDVLIFLDSHMECAIGWLEPILARLISQPNVILQPLLPHVSVIENPSYEGFMRGAFDWDLSYAWSPIPPYMSSLTPGATFPSPTLTGCAIGVFRSYFYYLGGFDPGMEIWGGEHFELSFRAWMCGATVETVTCSVVGHLYKFLTHDFKGDADTIKAKNNLRVAELWMDEYKTIIYAGLKLKIQVPEFSKSEWKSIEKRRELRQKLHCGTFKDYLLKFPELKVPSKDHVYFGAVRNLNTSYCLVVDPNGYVGVGQYECGDWRLAPEEQFIINKWGRLMFEDVCIGVEEKTMRLKANHDNCFGPKTSDLKWDLNPGPKVGRLQLSYPKGLFCAVQDSSVIKMIKCDDSPQQRWSFAYKFDFGISEA